MGKISDKYLKANHKEGEVFTSDYYNEVESVVKEAINGNADDIALNEEAIAILQDDMATAQSDIETLQSDLSDLQETVSTNYETLDGKIDNVESTLSTKIDDTKNELDDDIDKIIDGTTTVGNAALLNGVSEHKSTAGALYDTDTKLPTDKVVKDYVDPKFNERPTTITVTNMISEAIEGLGRVYIRKVEVLPQVGEEGTLYLVPSPDPGTSNLFDEYLYVDDAWEYVGKTEVDLSNYYTKSETYSQNEINTALGNKANASDLDNYLAKNNAVSYTPSGDYNPATKKYVDDITSSSIKQYSTMPTASADLLGEVVQYVGVTDINYHTGYFYQCVSDEQPTPTYSWEEVIGSVDLSNYLAKDNATSFTPTGDYNPATKKYVDDNIPVLPTLTDISHYKGHVSSTSALPSAGQPSGTLQNPSIIMSSQVYGAMLKKLSEIPNIGVDALYKNYYVALYNGDVNGTTADDHLGLVIATDFPEVITIGTCKRSDFADTGGSLCINITYDANKPVYYKYNMYYGYKGIPYLTTSSSTTQCSQGDAGSWLSITQNSSLWLSAPYGTSYNLPNVDDKYEYLSTNISELKYSVFNTATSSQNSYAVPYNTVGNQSNYYWNTGMIFVTYNGTDLSFKTDASSISEGDLYTVGNDYDIYRVHNNIWEHWSQADLSNYLAKNNTTTFTPSGDYNPATKKYVDDSISSAITDALTASY